MRAIGDFEEMVREKAEKEGIEKGQPLGMANLIEMQLIDKFKSIPQDYSKKLKEQSEAKLRVIEVEVHSQTTVACPVVRVDGLDFILYAF